MVKKPVEEVKELVEEQPTRKPLVKDPIEELADTVEVEEEKPARKPLRKPLVKEQETEELFTDENPVESTDVEFDSPEDLE